MLRIAESKFEMKIVSDEPSRRRGGRVKRKASSQDGKEREKERDKTKIGGQSAEKQLRLRREKPTVSGANNPLRLAARPGRASAALPHQRCRATSDCAAAHLTRLNG